MFEDIIQTNTVCLRTSSGTSDVHNACGVDWPYMCMSLHARASVSACMRIGVSTCPAALPCHPPTHHAAAAAPVAGEVAAAGDWVQHIGHRLLQQR